MLNATKQFPDKILLRKLLCLKPCSCTVYQQCEALLHLIISLLVFGNIITALLIVLLVTEETIACYTHLFLSIQTSGLCSDKGTNLPRAANADQMPIGCWFSRACSFDRSQLCDWLLSDKELYIWVECWPVSTMPANFC